MNARLAERQSGKATEQAMVASPSPSTTATRYDAEARDLARQLWGFKHSRNAAAVARELGWTYPGLDERTIRRWAADEAWAVSIARSCRELAPAIHEGILVDLLAGAAEGASYLRAAARGDEPAAQARVTAAVALLDRYGVGPRTEPIKLPAHYAAELDPDPEAARARMLARRAGWETPTD
jgi:hypothetical protein